MFANKRSEITSWVLPEWLRKALFLGSLSLGRVHSEGLHTQLIGICWPDEMGNSCGIKSREEGRCYNKNPNLPSPVAADTVSYPSTRVCSRELPLGLAFEKRKPRHSWFLQGIQKIAHIRQICGLFLFLFQKKWVYWVLLKMSVWSQASAVWRSTWPTHGGVSENQPNSWMVLKKLPLFHPDTITILIL